MDDVNLESRWASYAITPRSAGNSSRFRILRGVLAPAGAAIFSLPGQANASIIYSGPLMDTARWNNSAGAAKNYQYLPLKIGGGTFRFGGSDYIGPSGQGAQAKLQPNGFPGDFIAYTGGRSVKKLAKGSLIDGGLLFSSHGIHDGLKSVLEAGALQYGQFISGKPAYAGVKLPDGDYGWIELEYTATGTKGSNAPYPGSVEVLGDAYQTDGGSIAAGDIGVTGVPEASNTLTARLLLACAGASLAAWRKRSRAPE